MDEMKGEIVEKGLIRNKDTTVVGTSIPTGAGGGGGELGLLIS